MAARWLLLICLCVVPGLGWSLSTPILPSSEIERGMKGYGLTVFQGTKIDTFQVEIVGVMRNALDAKTDIIWAMMSGGPLEKTGIIAGMSGSPVYIGGKLIGAVAYGYAFCKEPLAGITPIEKMLEVFEKGLERKKDVYGGEPGGGVPWYSSLSGEGPRASEIPELDPFEGTGLEPLGTPLVFSGFHPGVVREARKMLARFGLTVVQGGGGGGAEVEASMLQPGAALAVPLIQGDYSVGGIGTLTYRDGDRVLGFGHPMFFDGDTEFPMGGAVISEVVPSVIRSFKLGSVAQPVGVIRQDRNAAVAGVVGELPEMVPVIARIGPSLERQSTYRFEVVRHREYTGWLVSWALMSAILVEESPRGERTIRVRSTIEAEGHPPVERENVFSSSSAVFESYLSILWPLEAMLSNEFERVNIKQLTFDLVTEEGIRSAVVEGLRVDNTTLRPGETVTGTAYLQRTYGGRFEQRFSIPVPKDTPDGSLVLWACDAASSRHWDEARAPGKYQARTMEDMIRILSYEERNDHLIVELFLPGAGLTVEGKELPALPGSVMAVLQGSRQTGQTDLVRGSTVARSEIKTDCVLSGAQSMALKISRSGR